MIMNEVIFGPRREYLSQRAEILRGLKQVKGSRNLAEYIGSFKPDIVWELVGDLSRIVRNKSALEKVISNIEIPDDPRFQVLREELEAGNELDYAISSGENFYQRKKREDNSKEIDKEDRIAPNFNTKTATIPERSRIKIELKKKLLKEKNGARNHKNEDLLSKSVSYLRKIGDQLPNYPNRSLRYAAIAATLALSAAGLVWANREREYPIVSKTLEIAPANYVAEEMPEPKYQATTPLPLKKEDTTHFVTDNNQKRYKVENLNIGERDILSIASQGSYALVSKLLPGITIDQFRAKGGPGDSFVPKFREEDVEREKKLFEGKPKLEHLIGDEVNDHFTVEQALDTKENILDRLIHNQFYNTKQ